MSKEKKLYNLRERIMCDIEKINVLLEIITSYRTETHKEAIILARLALAKSRNIGKNNEKIGKILNH